MATIQCNCDEPSEIGNEHKNNGTQSAQIEVQHHHLIFTPSSDGGKRNGIKSGIDIFLTLHHTTRV